MIYLQLIWAFLKIGVLGFGGGQAMIPLIEKEAVETYHWFTVAEFTDSIAFGNTLPGPIATKMAAAIGYKAGGVFGAMLSLAAMILPSIIVMILLFNCNTWSL